MGTLTPGAKYVYERADGVTYAREFGAMAEERFAIGWDYNAIPPKIESTILGVPVNEIAIYADMYEKSKTNPALQAALIHAKITYYLSKENGNSET